MRSQLDRWMIRRRSEAQPNHRIAPVLHLPVQHMQKPKRRFPYERVLIAAGIAVGVLLSLGVARAFSWF